jgi:hypothetical protein
MVHAKTEKKFALDRKEKFFATWGFPSRSLRKMFSNNDFAE